MSLIDQLPFPRVQLTARDFFTFRQALIDFINNERPDVINDFLDSQLGVMIIELCSYTGDTQAFDINRQSNEGYLPTAQERENAVKLTSLIGFQPFTATPASVTLTINNASPFALPATIAAGTQISLGDGLFFEFLSDYVLPAGTSFVLSGPTITEGRSFTENFTGSGAAGQPFELANYPVIEGTVVGRVDAVLHTQVDALVFAEDEPVYVFTLDENDQGTALFGNNINGLAPPNGSDVEFAYRVGGGVAGNVATAFIRTNVPATLSNGDPVNIFVENRSPASGGSDRETIESIKFNAPKSYKTRGNANTQRDFDTLARRFSDPSFGTIDKAKAVPRAAGTNCERNEIDIYVWTRGPSGALTGASTDLQDALLVSLNDRRILNLDLFISNGAIKVIDLEIDAISVPSFSDPEGLKEAIEEAVEAFFARPEIEPGDTFRVSQLYAVVAAVDSVVSSIIKDPATGLPISDITVSLNEAWSLGDLTVNVEVPIGSSDDTILLP